MILEGTGRFERTVECGSLGAALAQVGEIGRELGLVILDLGLPDATGLGGLDQLVAVCPDVPVIVVSGGAEAETIHASFARGARGYVPKNSSGPAFRAAVEAVLRGELYVPPQALPTRSSSPPPPLPSPAPPAVRLTQRQEDVLVLVARGLSNKEIASALDMSPATVRVHVTALFKALGVENRTQAAISERAQVLVSSRPPCAR